MLIGEKIKIIREMRGMSQSILAQKCNITNAAISQYESNVRIPNLTSFKSICNVLGVSYDLFLENTELESGGN